MLSWVARFIDLGVEVLHLGEKQPSFLDIPFLSDRLLPAPPPPPRQPKQIKKKKDFQIIYVEKYENLASKLIWISMLTLFIGSYILKNHPLDFGWDATYGLICLLSPTLVVRNNVLRQRNNCFLHFDCNSSCGAQGPHPSSAQRKRKR